MYCAKNLLKLCEVVPFLKSGYTPQDTNIESTGFQCSQLSDLAIYT